MDRIIIIVSVIFSLERESTTPHGHLFVHLSVTKTPKYLKINHSTFPQPSSSHTKTHNIKFKIYSLFSCNSRIIHICSPGCCLSICLSLKHTKQLNTIHITSHYLILTTIFSKILITVFSTTRFSYFNFATFNLFLCSFFC